MLYIEAGSSRYAGGMDVVSTNNPNTTVAVIQPALPSGYTVIYNCVTKYHASKLESAKKMIEDHTGESFEIE